MSGLDLFIKETETVAKPKLTIYKSKRVLELSDGGELLARIHIALGRGQGPKCREGDQKTPEGVYYTCVRNDKSKYHLSIGVSYPNEEDAQRGLDAGAIGRGEFERIVGAIRQGTRPPWDTALGGEIMIHGGGSNRDWTAGCIALDNGDMDYIWKHVENGAVVEILP